MLFAGIDIGSRTIELVVVDEKKRIQDRYQEDTGFDPIGASRKMLNQSGFERIMATGYGRNLFELTFDAPTVTEIKAHATGVRSLYPKSGTILDIGGQDSKAISMFENGKVKKFEMNDRCAAGTGKFLEIMAKTLGYTIEEFGAEALRATNEFNISSMCTVFAESEVISLITKGHDRRAIARGLHASVVRRAAAMINRVSAQGDIVFSGGVAQNPCLVAFLEEKLKRRVLVPPQPQFVGAFGAALLAADMNIAVNTKSNC